MAKNVVFFYTEVSVQENIIHDIGVVKTDNIMESCSLVL